MKLILTKEIMAWITHNAKPNIMFIHYVKTDTNKTDKSIIL